MPPCCKEMYGQPGFCNLNLCAARTRCSASSTCCSGVLARQSASTGVRRLRRWLAHRRLSCLPLTNGRTNCGAIRRVWCPNDRHLRASQWAPAQASMAMMQAGAWTSHACSCLRFNFLRVKGRSSAWPGRYRSALRWPWWSPGKGNDPISVSPSCHLGQADHPISRCRRAQGHSAGEPFSLQTLS